MMKKSMIFLGLLALTLVVAGCSLYGSAGNPTELTGTWTGSVKSSSGSGTVAGSSEGTWTLTKTENPLSMYNYTLTGSTVNYHVVYDPSTTTYTRTVVLAADASYTDTTTTVLNTPTRSAYTTSSTDVYISDPNESSDTRVAITAGVYTTVDAITVTYSKNSDGTYQKTVAEVVTTTGTGAYSGTSFNTKTTKPTYTTQITAVSVPSLLLSYAYLSYNTSTGGHVSNTASAALQQTVKVNTVSDTAVSYSLVIGSDATYTLTSTTVTTITSPSAGTQTDTKVETGTINGSVDGTTKYITFNKTSTKDTYVGTGSGVTASYPSTAVSYTNDAASASTTQYYITSSKYLVFVNSGSSMPTLTISK